MRFCRKRFLLMRSRPRPIVSRRPLHLESLEQRTVPSAGLVTPKLPILAGGTPVGPIASPERLVTGLYYDVLNRQPNQAEVDNWMSLIKNDQLDSNQVALGFVTSTEYLAKTIAADYQQYLGRAPQAGEMTGWLNQLSGNSLTLQQITASFVSSKEYYARQGGTDFGWLTGVYQDLLGR